MPAQANAGGRRLALLVATATYNDPTLQRLRSPAQDVRELKDLLGDPSIGEFDVQDLVNAKSDDLRRAVSTFCRAAKHGDLLLIYMSCHGLLDDRGRLYYATVDTERDLLAATGLRADWLMSNSRRAPLDVSS
jgi:uncharacterized caspase-like protein